MTNYGMDSIQQILDRDMVGVLDGIQADFNIAFSKLSVNSHLFYTACRDEQWADLAENNEVIRAHLDQPPITQLSLGAMLTQAIERITLIRMNSIFLSQPRIYESDGPVLGPGGYVDGTRRNEQEVTHAVSRPPQNKCN